MISSPKLQVDKAVKAGILLPAVVAMAWGIFAPIHGNFYFRQAHVAANIEKYVAHGLSMTPETYNFDIPYSLFDFPLYQLVVAAVARLFGGDPLVTARLLSILSFVLSFLVIDRLLARTSIPKGQRLFVLFFFVYAPLNLFYFLTPLVDCLAILLSLLSLYALVRWDEAGRPAAKNWFWHLMVASGVVSTLIKNPVYLSVFLSISCFALFKYRWKSFVRPGILIYVLAIGCAVVVFKLYANALNQVSGFWDNREVGEYFGSLMDRIDPWSWRRVLEVLATQTANGLTVVLSAIGVGLYVKDSQQKYKSLYLGLLLGAFVALLVFFNRYTWHNYYQLPLVFPLSFFAGYGAFRITSLLGAKRPGTQTAFAILVVTSSLYWAVARFPELSGTPTQWIASNGEWIQYHTGPDDFVVYILDTVDPTDWNPVFLYFAKRDGYNLPRRKVKKRNLEEIIQRFSSRYERILVFCPMDLHERMSPRLESVGAELREVGPNGMLYQLATPSS